MKDRLNLLHSNINETESVDVCFVHLSCFALKSGFQHVYVWIPVSGTFLFHARNDSDFLACLAARYRSEPKIVSVQYFVRGGLIGHRSRASSKHLSSHLPVDGVRFLGGQKGVALQLQDARVVSNKDAGPLSMLGEVTLQLSPSNKDADHSRCSEK
ncbi:uncharacterized protein TNCV_4364571 [Trichonephila clavipes]|nr:uncharacterized protein TNCV_4364571 [Trichonephila clavipes]